MRLLLVVLVVSCLSARANAQAVARSVVPKIGNELANSLSFYPWNQRGSDVRDQYVYDPSEMPPFPIEIKRVRFRAWDGYGTGVAWKGGAYNGATIVMSTGATSYSSVKTSFAGNHGTDAKTVFAGTVAVSPGQGTGNAAPSPYYVDITLTNSFRYDPAKGPFVIDISSDGAKWVPASGSGLHSVDSALVVSNQHKITRLFSRTSHTATAGRLQTDTGLVMELTYSFNAIVPDFTVDRQCGPTGSIVTFQDKTISSVVYALSWDLNGDGQFGDSTIANPSYVYTRAGKYDVSLRVMSLLGTFTEKKVGVIEIAIPVKSPPDIIQYQFNEARPTDKVTNTATGTSAPPTGTMDSAAWHGDAERRFFNGNERGFGMVAQTSTPNRNYVTTGWKLKLDGSMTIMWWQKLDKSVTTTNPFGYVFGGPGSDVRCFMAGAAEDSVMFRGTKPIGDFSAGQDLMVPDRWIHLALVIDDSSGAATWFVDGCPTASKSFGVDAFKNSPVTNTMLLFGQHDTQGSFSLSRYYSYDDVRVYGRAVSLAEILGAVKSENASAGSYGVECGSGSNSPPKIAGVGGQPFFGNGSFAIEAAGAPAKAPCAIVVGAFVRSGLPIRFGFYCPGAKIEVGRLFSVVLGRTDVTGRFRLALPVPSTIPAAAGRHAYAQFAYDGQSPGVSSGLDINVQAR